MPQPTQEGLGRKQALWQTGLALAWHTHNPDFIACMPVQRKLTSNSKACDKLGLRWCGMKAIFDSWHACHTNAIPFLPGFTDPGETDVLVLF
jgi:hypothetical protein